MYLPELSFFFFFPFKLCWFWLGMSYFSSQWLVGGCIFKFVLEAALITQGCFIFCWAELAHQGLFCLLAPTSEWAGDAQGVWRHRVRRSDLSRAKEYPKPCSATKAGEEGRGDAGSDGICFSKVNVLCDAAPLFWGCLNSCLLRGSSEYPLCFSSLVCAAFALPINLCTNPWVFWLLHTQLSPPSLCNRVSICMGLSFHKKPTTLFSKSWYMTWKNYFYLSYYC